MGIGASAGASARYVEDLLGRASWIVLAAIVAFVVGVVLWQRFRARDSSPQKPLERAR